MNDSERQAVNAACARVEGLKNVRVVNAWSDSEKMVVRRLMHGEQTAEMVPDYTSDGNAARRAAGKLPRDTEEYFPRLSFIVALGRMVRGEHCTCGGGDRCEDCEFNLITAPAELIARAVAKAAG